MFLLGNIGRCRNPDDLLNGHARPVIHEQGASTSTTQTRLHDFAGAKDEVPRQVGRDLDVAATDTVHADLAEQPMSPDLVDAFDRGDAEEIAQRHNTSAKVKKAALNLVSCATNARSKMTADSRLR
jgi:hypothetical protein